MYVCAHMYVFMHTYGYGDWWAMEEEEEEEEAGESVVERVHVGPSRCNL